jgi:nucleotidyltransferase substrate binding protein (TIGR01987 family)
MDIRIKDIDMHLETLEQALALLEEVLSEPFSALMRDAAIHRFEYTFELSWKLLRRIAQVEGRQADSPWQAIRTAAEAELLQNIDLWFEMVECRNSVTMTFMPDIADQVFQAACSLPSSLKLVIGAIKKKYF